jgi:hypothetical protein
MLQDERPRVRFPVRRYDFFLPKLSSLTVTLGSSQPLREMSDGNLPGGKGGRRNSPAYGTAVDVLF